MAQKDRVVGYVPTDIRERVERMANERNISTSEAVGRCLLRGLDVEQGIYRGMGLEGAGA